MATADLLERRMGPVQQAMSDAKVDEVLLVGGSTGVPAVQALARWPTQHGADTAPRQSRAGFGPAVGRRFPCGAEELARQIASRAHLKEARI
jgi:molecular chaperone DnaK (HSP70)